MHSDGMSYIHLYINVQIDGYAMVGVTAVGRLRRWLSGQRSGLGFSGCVTSDDAPLATTPMG
eukprot:COSAG02_NODE_33381_length_500_cov_15.102244_2_plen_61_part_01